jgi:hypothetical protein
MRQLLLRSHASVSQPLVNLRKINRWGKYNDFEESIILLDTKYYSDSCIGHLNN